MKYKDDRILVEWFGIRRIHCKIAWIIGWICVVLLFGACMTLSPPESRKQKQMSKKLKGADVAELQIDKKGASVTGKNVLISNHINDISADENNVWIATDLGVSRLDRKANRWTNNTKEDGLGADNVNAVLSETDENIVWFGTSDGVSRYNTVSGEWKTFKSKDGLTGTSVFCIAADGRYIWFGTDGGLNRYDKSTDSWAARAKSDGLSSDSVSAIAVTNEYVWVGTRAQVVGDRWSSRKEGGGVNKYDKTTDSWNRYSKKDGLVDDQISTIAVSENFVYFGTYGKGISVYSKTDQAFIKMYTKTDLLVSNDISSITMDGSSLWIGTANGGAQRYIKPVDTWITYTHQDGLPSDHITDIAIYKNEVWFGSYDSGVSVYDKVANTWTTYQRADTLPDDDIRDIVSDASSKLWIATAGGLTRYDPQTQGWTKFGKESSLTTDEINAISLSESAGSEVDGQLWVGTARGLGNFDERGNRWRFYTASNGGIAEEFITSISIDDKFVWVGTNRGLFYKSLQNSAENNFKPVPQIGDELVNTIAADGEYLWVGTANGLLKYSISSQTVSKSPHSSVGLVEHGLPNNYVNAILPLETEVFVGTRGGLSIYNRNSDAFLTVLPGDNVRALAYDKARHCIWIGASDGLAKYDLKTRQYSNLNNLTNRFSTYNIKTIEVLDDTLWLGTTSGVVEYQISKETVKEHRSLVTRQPLREYGVSNIEFDGDHLWFSNWSGSRNGAIVRYSRRSGTWQRFTREIIFKDTKARSMTNVKQIYVDKGAVWFATDYGVLRYDKALDIWEHFTIKDGLVSNDVRRIEAGEDVVWVSFERGHKINRYDKKSGKWTTIELSNILYYADSVRAMAADGNAVWVGFWSSGLRKVSPDGQEQFFKTEEGEVRRGVRWISVDGDTLWFANWRGSGQGALSRYNKKTGEWTDYSKADVLEDDWIDRIFVGERHVWILYRSWRESGVTGYDKLMDEWTTIKPKGDYWRSGITEICEDGDYLWLATEGDGIKRFHKSSGTWTSFDDRNGLLQNKINERALKVDENYVWVGTPRGLSRYDKKKESWTSYTKRDTLIGKTVHAVTVDSRYVWCGTAEGISRYDKVNGTWKNFRKKGGYQRMITSSGSFSWWEPESTDSLIDNNVSALAVDDRYLWVGTRAGACRYDKITDRWDRFTKRNGLPGEDISAVIVDGYDVWMGTNNGICKFPRMSDDLNAWVSFTSGIEIKPDMSKEYAATLVSNEVWALAADDNYIWVGTMRGVSRYDKKKDLWTTFTTEDGLPANSISSIVVDGDIVWFGSDSGAAMYDKRTKDWVTFTVDDGLASNRITCIAKDKKEIWFGTFDAGVMRYDKETKTWSSYTRKEGLAHNCVLSLAVDGDYLWIGTQQGLSRFDKTNYTWTTYTEYQDSEDI
ncbi:TPA: hypothetical protein EYP66_09530 [Candidatus Poribacteria bacterium]|nr:hypothetical protein [Candidatus Poribacteria bacterium]